MHGCGVVGGVVLRMLWHWCSWWYVARVGVVARRCSSSKLSMEWS